jgi:hypothetical protein
MKTPKKLVELLNNKQAFIDQRRGKLEKDVIRMQSQLLDRLLAEIIPSLDIKDGVIQDTTKNYRLLSGLDKVYDRFITAMPISAEFIKSTAEIIELNKVWFQRILPEDVLRFDKVIEATAAKINLKIGIRNGKLIPSGFLDSVIKDKAVITDVKNFMSKSITGQVDQKQFISGLTELVNGEPNKVGKLERQYQRYGYDLYQQYDRAYGSSLADEFEMNYFLYQGGLVEDSRDFCVAHNNKVWSREEAAEWDTWKPYLGEYPAGYEIKQKDIYDIPSYMGYPGYQPLIDAGGYNCRHSIGWISTELAMSLRPELKGTE